MSNPPKYGSAFAHFPDAQEGAEACIALKQMYDISSINTMLNNFIVPLQGTMAEAQSNQLCHVVVVIVVVALDIRYTHQVYNGCVCRASRCGRPGSLFAQPEHRYRSLVEPETEFTKSSTVIESKWTFPWQLFIY